MFSKFTRKTRCLLWTLIVGAFLTIFSIVFAIVILPIIIEKVLSDYLVLTNGTEAWDRFMELPFPMDFNIYFFEVINTDAVRFNKSKPYLKQIGPFIYKNYRKKIDVERLDDEHVSYYTIQNYDYDHERSELSDDHNFTGLNFMAIGLFQILENARIGFNYTIEELLPDVIHETELFHTVHVKNFLFGGVPFCDRGVDATLEAKLICMVVMFLNLKMITYHEDLSMSYSLFGFKNETHDGKFVINTGEKDITKLGEVQSWNDMKYTNIWKGDESECNKVSGYDIAVFAPYLKQNENFDIYSTDICRAITMQFLKKDEFRDIEVYKYGFNEKTFTPENNVDPKDSCYCSDYTRGLDGEKSCFMDGLQDIYPCLGIPGMASFPHFLHADKKYSDTVENLHPDEELHASYLNIQPLTAAPLEGWISLQINLILRPIRLSNKIVNMTEQLANTSLPVLWLQQGVTITDEYYDIISYAVTLLTVAEVGKWVFVLISGLIFLYPVAKLLVGTI